MGVMGLWHIIIAVSLSLVNFPVAWHQLSIGFLAPPVNFTCVSPSSADNESMWMKCNVHVANGDVEKCHEFEYDRSVFTETIVTQVRRVNYIIIVKIFHFSNHSSTLLYLIYYQISMLNHLQYGIF